MAVRHYVFGREAALCTGKEDQDFGCMCTAISCAVRSGYSFIIEVDGRDKAVYAWDFEVLSYNEACQRFGFDAEKMVTILGASKKEVFILAKAGGTDTLLFSFKGFKRLVKINPEEYISQQSIH